MSVNAPLVRRICANIDSLPLTHLHSSAAKKEKEDKEKEKEKETRSSGLKLFHFRVGAEKKSSPQPSPTAHREATGPVSAAPSQSAYLLPSPQIQKPPRWHNSSWPLVHAV